MTKIKICGLRREEDISYANELMPDYIGFVFAQKSKRKVDYNTSKNLKKDLSARIKAVGVFVNEDIEFIEKLCKENIIDLVQLHGDEDIDYYNNLKNKIDKKIKIIKAFRVKEKVNENDTFGDFLLFDTFSEGAYGGTGKTFNHSYIDEIKTDFFVAGGLNKDNVLEVIEKTNPFCVDLSGGVETDGFKDFNKMKEIISLVKGEI